MANESISGLPAAAGIADTTLFAVVPAAFVGIETQKGTALQVKTYVWTSPNLTGTVNVASLTASQAVVTDGSKNLTSLGYGSANTASTLVQRNGSGDFSAGTITANLAGNASTASSTPASGLTGNTLAAGVIHSSLVDLGALTNLNLASGCTVKGPTSGTWTMAAYNTGLAAYNTFLSVSPDNPPVINFGSVAVPIFIDEATIGFSNPAPLYCTTLTQGGHSISFSGSTYSFTGALTGNTNVTFPQSGTLATTGDIIGGIEWENVSGDVTLQVGQGAIITDTNSEQTYPATISAGQMFGIVNRPGANYSLVQNDGQITYTPNGATTSGVGGGFFSTADVQPLIFLCITDNTEFMLIGNLGQPNRDGSRVVSPLGTGRVAIATSFTVEGFNLILDTTANSDVLMPVSGDLSTKAGGDSVGWVRVATATAADDTDEISITGIPTTYTDLQVVITGSQVVGSASADCVMTVNGVETGSYDGNLWYGNDGGGPTPVGYEASNNWRLGPISADEEVPGLINVYIPRYTNTNQCRVVEITNGYKNFGATSRLTYEFASNRASDPITSIAVFTDDANYFLDGTTVDVYARN